MTAPQPMATQAATDARWRFGAFVVWESQRRIERNGQTVRVGSRAFDLLLQLIKRAGEVISKDQLLAAVWADVVVEEASVRVHMSTLRKALGEPGEGDECKEWISNIPLRGYRFNGRVSCERSDEPPVIAGEAKPMAPVPGFARLPVRLTKLVGRADQIERVLGALQANRLVTIIGTGGIGKTRVAIRSAERLEEQAAVQIAFIDFSSLISQDHVLSTMARALGAPPDIPDTMQIIHQRLKGRDALLLLDNCEHVLDTLAPLLAGLVAALPGLRVLATSREAFRMEGEHVVRLPALALPDDEVAGLAEALRAPAVELLVERAKAAGAGNFSDADGALLARISRQIDGIPLAIELVAARLGVQSIGDLARRLADHIRIYAIDSRSALPRHRTLAAALDWSLALLNDTELRLFRRLSVFRGRFDVESALGLAAGDMDPDAAFDALISLANKSLVFFDGSDGIAPYRLLDTTRSYAAELLAQSGEQPAMLARHATFMLELMKAATKEMSDLSEQAWNDRHAHRLDDVRCALEVCLTRQPDAKTAAALAIASAPLWYRLAQVEEYRDRVSAALALVEQQPEPDTETATWLNTALVSALLHTGGSIPALSAACERAVAGALKVKVRVLELQARWGGCTHDMFRGEYATALRHGEAMHAVVQSWSDPAALNLSHRVMAMASHFCGQFDTSRLHSEAAIRLGDDSGRARATMVGVDPIVAAQAMLSRTYWIQGETSKALATASDAVARAQRAGSYLSLCAALYGACAVALWSDELELARIWVRLMRTEAERRGLVGWLRHAEWFNEGLQARLAQQEDPRMRNPSDRFAAYDVPRKEMLVTFCPDVVDDEMIARVLRGDGQWSAAEVWRAAGWRSERRGATQEAEEFYLRALSTARQQGAVGWELRASASLAMLCIKLDRPRQATQLLDEVCQRVPADSGNAQLTQVQVLRDRLSGTQPG